VQNIVTAVFAAQPIIDRRRIEERRRRRLGQAGYGQQLGRGKVGYDEANALCRELAETASDIAVLRDDYLETLK